MTANLLSPSVLHHETLDLTAAGRLDRTLGARAAQSEA